MSYLVNSTNCGLTDTLPSYPASGSGNSLTSDILSAIPMALASPILSYQRTKEQARLTELAIEARRLERSEIMKTMRVLAENGALTPEITQYLMVAYYQQPF